MLALITPWKVGLLRNRDAQARGECIGANDLSEEQLSEIAQHMEATP